MKKDIRIGVAGLGFGVQVHVPVFQSIPGVEVVALVGRDFGRVQQVARTLRIPYAFSKLEDFFAHDLDAVSLALPPAANVEAAVQAFRQNIPVLLEKPIAGTYREAQKLVRANQGSLSIVDFQFAELAVFKQLKKIIEKEHFGKVLSATLTWQLESFAQQHQRWSWKTNQHEGGGVLSLLGSHFLYLAEWFFGPVRRLTASLDVTATQKFAPRHKRAAPDSLAAILQFASGSILTAHISNANPSGIGHRWEIAFEKATAVLYNPPGDYMAGFSLSVRQKSAEKVLLRDPRKPSHDGRIAPFRSLALRFLKAVRSGEKKVLPSLASGLRVQQLISAIQKSSQKHLWISV